MNRGYLHLVDLTSEEMMAVDGGQQAGTCALIGATMVSAAAFQVWPLAIGMVVAGYSAGCFSSW